MEIFGYSKTVACVTDGNKLLVNAVCETATKTLSLARSCVPGFEYAPRLACLKSHCKFANYVEGKLETHFR